MRYFFDVENGELLPDGQGLEFQTVEAAVAEAGRAASGLSADLEKGGRLTIHVRDAEGPVARVSVSIDIEHCR